MGDTVGKPETAGAHPEEQESRRTAATPAVDPTITGDTRHTVIELRTLETNSTVEPDSRRSIPVELLSDVSQQRELGVSEGHRCDKRQKL